jgi:hypothetical protein
VEGRGCDLMNMPSRHYPEGTEEIHENCFPRYSVSQPSFVPPHPENASQEIEREVLDD